MVFCFQLVSQKRKHIFVFTSPFPVSSQVGQIFSNVCVVKRVKLFSHNGGVEVIEQERRERKVIEMFQSVSFNSEVDSPGCSCCSLSSLFEFYFICFSKFT